MKKTAIQTISILFMVSTFVEIPLQAQSSANSGVDFTIAAEKSVHSVVHIQCFYSVKTSTMLDFFDLFMNPFSQMQPQQRTYQTSGSGVIMSKDGYIITNNHVVEQADSIIVILDDRRQFQARLIGNDPSSDLAVIKVDNVSGLSVISFANSDNVKVGEWVIAVGNPFNLTSTITHGIVSAKARNINILGNKMSETPIESFIQTDAAVNPGNSGGALVNLQGELLGINTAIASSTGSFTGYSFAIPSNIVKKVTTDLVKYRQTQKAYLGISFAEIDDSYAKMKNLKDIHGIYVESIFKDGAAFKAGLKENDIITKINGKNVNTKGEFNDIMAQLSPNEQVEIEYERGNSINTKTITLLDSEGNTNINEANGNKIMAVGATFRKVSVGEKSKYNLQNGVGMVIISLKNSSLGRVGIREGLIITSIDNEPATVSVIQKLEKKKGNQVVIEGFYPNGQQVYYMMIL